MVWTVRDDVDWWNKGVDYIFLKMVSNSFLWIQTGHGALAGIQLIFWDGSVNFCGLQMIPSDLLGALHPNQWLQPAVKPLQMHHHLLSLWRNDSSNKIKQRIKVIVVMEISKNPMANTKCPCSSPQINHDLILNTMIYPKLEETRSTSFRYGAPATLMMLSSTLFSQFVIT